MYINTHKCLTNLKKYKKKDIVRKANLMMSPNQKEYKQAIC